MQFSFLGFSTTKIMEFKLDVKDIIILKYFNDFKNTGKMNYEIINGEKYYWMSYQNIENELPFLGLAKRAIMTRMLRMKKLGILKHYTKKDGGTFSYYALSEKFNELLYVSSRDNNKESYNRENENLKSSYKEDYNIYTNINDEKLINNNDDMINKFEESYEVSNAVDELENLFRSESFSSKNIEEEINEGIINKGIHFKEESVNYKVEDVINSVDTIDNYYEYMQDNLKEGVLFSEFKPKNVQGLYLNSDKGCASKERTKTNILKNNNTIVTNLYNNNIYNNIKDIVSKVVSYLNTKIGVNYKTTNTKTINLIKLRLKEGFTVEDFKTVVDKKIEAWKGTALSSI